MPHETQWRIGAQNLTRESRKWVETRTKLLAEQQERRGQPPDQSVLVRNAGNTYHRSRYGHICVAEISACRISPLISLERESGVKFKLILFGAKLQECPLSLQKANPEAPSASTFLPSFQLHFQLGNSGLRCLQTSQNANRSTLIFHQMCHPLEKTTGTNMSDVNTIIWKSNMVFRFNPPTAFIITRANISFPSQVLTSILLE